MLRHFLELFLKSLKGKDTEKKEPFARHSGKKKLSLLNSIEIPRIHVNAPIFGLVGKVEESSHFLFVRLQKPVPLLNHHAVIGRSDAEGLLHKNSINLEPESRWKMLKQGLKQPKEKHRKTIPARDPNQCDTVCGLDSKGKGGKDLNSSVAAS